MQMYKLMKGSITDCQIIRISGKILHGSFDYIMIAKPMQNIAGQLYDGCKEIVEPLKAKVIVQI